MKLIITTLTLIFISFGANAITVEKLYKFCKPYQNNGFQFDNLSSVQKNNAVGCLSYITGMVDKGSGTCRMIKEINKKKLIDKKQLNFLSSLIANERAQINAIIASFNNYAENNTDKWKYTPGSYTYEFISKKFPCKLDK